ncbi:MFS transporter [Pseudomonas cremoricolorata]|uniref:MFS transporter n=1 Tax=Pseudomonas cremoricolorata TaxID=157783 RepID=A0A089WS90_9PSED|nr:MFS transporter [Pseudomonas cremoricolorata]AIR90034.1 MFS transporter [Pseudomonas cremoricolorata]
MNASTAAPAVAGSHRSSAGIVILALSAFLIVTTEFLIVGLLPGLARDLGISISAAGQLVTLFAFTVMLAGPPMTAALAYLNRRMLFTGILLLFAAANALAALAPNIWVLALARFIPALALPVFWGTASETAASIVPPEAQGQAVARVYLGISAALLLGIPLGTLAAEAVGWRGAFWALAALSLVMAVAMAMCMPTPPKAVKVNLASQLKLFREPYFLINLMLSVVVFSAMFTAYTYLADLLVQRAGVSSPNLGWWLMAFGTVGLIGNWLGGVWVTRTAIGATAVFVLLLAVGMGLFGGLTQWPVLQCLALALWAVANTALYPICQVRVMNAVSHSKALAGTANVSAANAGIGLGAVIGGAVIPTLGLAAVSYTATALALLALLLTPAVARLRPAG